MWLSDHRNVSEGYIANSVKLTAVGNEKSNTQKIVNKQSEDIYKE